MMRKHLVNDFCKSLSSHAICSVYNKQSGFSDALAVNIANIPIAKEFVSKDSYFGSYTKWFIDTRDSREYMFEKDKLRRDDVH